MCMTGLLLVSCAPVARSHEQRQLPHSNDGHSRNVQVVSEQGGGIPNANININDYCGRDWTDAFNTCQLACPSGMDSECTALGGDYKCQSFTMCHENLLNGNIIPNRINNVDDTPPPTPLITPPPTPKPTANPVEPAVAIKFPVCPPEYVVSNDYGLGHLVAYPIEGSMSKEVYECQGDMCNAGPQHAPGSDNAHLNWNMVGTCPDPDVIFVEPTQGSTIIATLPPPASVTTDATAAAPLTGPKWWLGVNQCIYSEDYAQKYDITKVELMEVFIFDTKEECCTAYPIACVPVGEPAPGPDAVPTTPNQQETLAPVSASPGTPAPTTDPTQNPTYTDSEMPTGMSSATTHGQCIWFGMATILLALLS